MARTCVYIAIAIKAVAMLKIIEDLSDRCQIGPFAAEQELR
jgi:hypothetical protein